jgi:hypothetical protein
MWQAMAFGDIQDVRRRRDLAALAADEEAVLAAEEGAALAADEEATHNTFAAFSERDGSSEDESVTESQDDEFGRRIRNCIVGEQAAFAADKEATKDALDDSESFSDDAGSDSADNQKVTRRKMFRSEDFLDFVRSYPEYPDGLNECLVCDQFDDDAWCPCCLSFWIRDYADHHYGSDNAILIRKDLHHKHFSSCSLQWILSGYQMLRRYSPSRTSVWCVARSIMPIALVLSPFRFVSVVFVIMVLITPL